MPGKSMKSERVGRAGAEALSELPSVNWQSTPWGLLNMISRDIVPLIRHFVAQPLMRPGTHSKAFRHVISRDAHRLENCTSFDFDPLLLGAGHA